MTAFTTKIALALSAVTAVAMGAAPASAADRHIRIVNYADQPVYNFYVSNIGTDSYGPDQLGSDTIRGNSYVTWNIDDGSGYCHFDFKFVMADGSVRVKNNYNVCTETHLDILN